MKLQTTSYQLPAKSGFTLIESLVAITVLLIGVLGPMTAATRGITDGLYAQNQLIGTYLAQEGLELLSARIDQNNKGDSLDHNGDGDQDIDDLLYRLGACKNPSFCAVVFASATNLADVTFEACASASAYDCQVAYHETDGFYKPHDGVGNFIGPVFRRTLMVQVLTTGPVAEVLLESRVEWRNKPADSIPKVVELSRYAFHQKSL